MKKTIQPSCPIEFRVWDKIKNQFLLPTDNKIKSGAIFFLDKNGLLTASSNTDNFVFQQFTGLLDKNKKKIFEGDIIKLPFYESGQEVIFENGYFCLEESGDFLFEINEKSKIIGNIFENPELLK